jgi:hypothetical protein
MKCPKCGYISFDYNQVCPKCNKDIGNEQEKLNLPGFKPDPPYLLEALTGAASASRIGLEAGTYVESPEMESVLDGGMDDTGAMEKASVFGKNGEGFEMGMEDQAPEPDLVESGDSIETDISAVDLSEIEMEDEGEDQNSLTLDLGDLPDESETTGPPPAPADGMKSGTVVISGLTAANEDMGRDTSLGGPDEEISIDLDEVSDESLEAAMALEREDAELTLDLEELSQNGKDLDEISFEPGNEFEEGSFDFSEMGLDASGKGTEADKDPFTESEMLTVELDSEKKEKPVDAQFDSTKENDAG